MKKVLLIIASDGFQPVEYWTTKKVLEDAGMEVATGGDKAGAAKAPPYFEYSPTELRLDTMLSPSQ